MTSASAEEVSPAHIASAASKRDAYLSPLSIPKRSWEKECGNENCERSGFHDLPTVDDENVMKIMNQYGRLDSTRAHDAVTVRAKST